MSGSLPSRGTSLAGVFDRACASYGQPSNAFFWAAGRDLAARARIQPGDVVLDLGCGQGATLVPAARATGATGTALGLDISPAMLATANSRLAAEDLTWAAAILGNAQDPDLPAASQDVLIAAFVIFFLADPVRALQRYAELLRPGGHLALTLRGRDIPQRARVQQVYAAAIRPFRPRAAPSGRYRRCSAFRDIEILDAVAADPRLRIDEIVEWVHPLTFGSAEEYWQWKWSHGGRHEMEQIEPARRDAARREVITQLARVAGAQGEIEHPMPATFVFATRVPDPRWPS